MGRRLLPKHITANFLVQERLNLVEKLFPLQDAFKGDHLIQQGVGFEGRPFKHYHSLMNYICLTCFDVLGQPDGWMAFNSWLSSTKVRIERDEAIEAARKISWTKVRRMVFLMGSRKKAHQSNLRLEWMGS